MTISGASWFSFGLGSPVPSCRLQKQVLGLPQFPMPVDSEPPAGLSAHCEREAENQGEPWEAEAREVCARALYPVVMRLVDNTFISFSYLVNNTISLLPLGLETFSQLVYQDSYGAVSIPVVSYCWKDTAVSRSSPQLS